MGEKNAFRHIILEAIRIRGSQAVVAEEAGMDGSSLSRVLSGEGAIKLDQLQKIADIVIVHVIPEQEHSDFMAVGRMYARMVLAA